LVQIIAINGLVLKINMMENPLNKLFRGFSLKKGSAPRHVKALL
jgi:hypothetical protein